MAAGNGRHAPKGARGRARTWIVLAALLLLLCTGTVMLALSDPQEDAAEETARSGDSIESAPGGSRAWDGSVRAATRTRRPPPAEPPGVNPRAEPWGVRTDVSSVAESGAAPTEPEQEPETGGGRHEPNAVSSHPSAARGATKSRRTPDGAVPVELVVTVTAAETDKRLGGADVSVVQGDAAANVLRTRPDGTVHVPLLSGLSYVLDVKARGRLRVRRSGVAPSDGTASQSVALERGVVVHGFVTDEERRLRGAVVRAVALNSMRASIPFGPEPPTIEETTTARDGSYVLDCIPRGVACVLVAEAAGHVNGRKPIDPQPDPDFDVRRDFVIDRGVALVGLVTGPDEKPIEGASVCAFVRKEWSDLELLTRKPLVRDRIEWLEVAMLEQLRGAATGDDPKWYSRLMRTRTLEDGRFAVVVPEGLKTAYLLALHPDAGRSAAVEVDLPARRGFEMPLRGRVRAEFSVLTDKGRPAEGMTIESHFPWERWTAPSRSAGRYGFADMPEGVVVVDVHGPAGAPGTYAGRRTDADSVLWRVLLRDGSTLRGDVTDDRGIAVAGATLTAGPRTATSGERGEFEIVGVHPDTRQIVATAAGHLRATVGVDGKVSGRIPVTVPRASNVRVELVLPHRAPPPAWYRVSRGVDSTPPGENAWEDQFVWNAGVVEVGGWGSNDGTIFVFVPGFQVVELLAKTDAGASLDLGRIELVEQETVDGVVADEHGRRVPGARVEGRPLGGERWVDAVPVRGVDADDYGRFEIGLPRSKRSYEIVVTAADRPATPQIVHPSQTSPLTVVVGRSRDFFGLWTSCDGRAARAQVLGPGDIVYADVSVDKDGAFRAEIPLTAQAVRIESAAVTQRVAVPADFVEGAIFEIR